MSFRCTIGRVFTLVLVTTVLILAATLLSDYRDGVQRNSAKKARYNKSLPKGGQVIKQSTLDQVNTFLMFIGYPRSGHSIIGSCIDAHPDAVVAHEFNLMTKLIQPNMLQYYRNRSVLFNSLYQNSYRESLLGWRSPAQSLKKKGYSLKMSKSNDSWQGKFRHLKVIGDKAGGLTAHCYRDSPKHFIKAYKELVQIVEVPIKFLHVVRNPYDIVATKLSYRLSEQKGRKGNFSTGRPITNARQIMQAVKSLEGELKAVKESIAVLKLDTLIVHNMDFVLDTKNTVLRICKFLGMECTERYLQLCDDTVYDKLSKSRDLIMWTESSRKYVDQLIQEYSFLNRYTFEN